MTVLLHGFWGQPADWNTVLQRLPINEIVLTPDLYEPSSLDPRHKMQVWCENFLNWLDKEAGSEPIQIVGYSMGARLALNAIASNPVRFKRALLLSGGFFISEFNKAERLQWETQWSERFTKLSWPELEALWQEQAIFSDRKAMPRRHQEALREMLGMSLLNWSIRNHLFSLDEVRALPKTVDYAYGALDQKYMVVAKTLQELPVQGQITVIPEAGHRLLLDGSEYVALWIQQKIL